MSGRDWIGDAMQDAYDEFREPPHRTQKHPLPEVAPVLAQAKQRRLTWLEAMRSVSQSSLSEQGRAERQSEIDSLAAEDYTE